MQFHIILVSPGVPENIGFVCRIIKTMGLHQLHLVNPCKFWLKRGKITAYQSHDILEGAILHDTLEDAVMGMDLTIGTTAKTRETRKDALSAGQMPESIEASVEHGGKVALVFGSEESGLSTNDLKLCDWVSYIPLTTSYPSLNLSHAVMIYAYECFKILNDGERQHPMHTHTDTPSIKVLKDKSQQILEWLQVDEHPALYQRIKDRVMLLKTTDQKMVLSLYRFIKRKMR